MSDDAPLVAPGDVLDGKYVVERTLGQGGMGVVVAAQHVVSKARVAIKLLLPAAGRDAQNRKRFEREARAALRLKSSHAARVHDVGQLANGTPYMVMDLLVGTDLEALLEKRGALSPSETVGFAVQALEAVEEAHALGIIHRDLKPANLFLADQENGLPIVKVLDFGIARDFEEGKQQKLTLTGDVMGSPAYMSPEQMVQARIADARSDVWSMGVCLYELLTGTLPFNGKTLAELCEKVQCAAPRSPDAVRPGVSPALSKIVLRCLEKDPVLRFGSATELRRALAGWEPAPIGAEELATTLPDPAPAVVIRPPVLPRPAIMARRPVVPDPQRGAKLAGALGLGLAILAASAIAVVLLFRGPSVTPTAPASATPPPPATSAVEVVPVAPPAAETSAVVTVLPSASAVATVKASALRPVRPPPRSSASSAPAPPPPARSAPTFDPGEQL